METLIDFNINPIQTTQSARVGSIPMLHKVYEIGPLNRAPKYLIPFRVLTIITHMYTWTLNSSIYLKHILSSLFSFRHALIVSVAKMSTPLRAAARNGN